MVNSVIVDDKKHVRTPELWELIGSKEPDWEIYNDEDYDNYAEILHTTNAVRRNYDENNPIPKANKSRKWKHIPR